MFSDSSPARNWNSVIVVAARDEADNVVEVVMAASRYGRVVVVDDASADGTADLAERAGAAVFRHRRGTHIRQSYVDGFRLALLRDCRNIVQLDAGLSFDPDQVQLLLEALEAADMAVGSRYVAGSRCDQPRRRRVLSRAGSALVRLATGMPYSDMTSGFKAYRASLLQALDDEGVLENLKARAHAFQFELTYEIHRRGFRIAEVPVSYTSTRSSVNLAVVMEALRTVYRLALRRSTI